MSIEHSIFNVKYFGALGDGAADDFPAFQRALNAIDNLVGAPPGRDARGAVLWIPFGIYRLGRPLRIKRETIIQGVGRSSSRLVFSRQGGPQQQLAGIVVELHWKIPKTGAPEWDAVGTGTVIRDLSVTTDQTYYPPDHGPAVSVDDDDFFRPDDAGDILRTSSGIVLYAQARVENCRISGFEHDGIHINSAVGRGSNADSWQVENCVSGLNGRHGMFVKGGDSNVGCAINVTCSDNYRWGFFDDSFLGNTYMMCHAENNGQAGTPEAPFPAGGGAYRASNPNARNLFVNCYQENGQRSMLRYPGMAIGGMGGFVDDPDSVHHVAKLADGGLLSVDSLTVNGPCKASNRPIATIAGNAPQPIDSSDNLVLVDAHGGPVPLTLPAITGDARSAGLRLTVKKVDASAFPVTLSVANPATDLIDADSALTLSTPYSWVSLASGQVNVGPVTQNRWFLIGRG